LSQGEAGTTTAQLRAGNPGAKEEATAVGASTARRDMENMIAEARGITGPRTALHHHHLVREAKAEAEVQNLSQTSLMVGGGHGAYETLANA
jgi:hypothetical protein